MRMRVSPLFIAAMTLIVISTGGRAQDAISGEDPKLQLQPQQYLSSVLQLVSESCFERGDKPAELAALARARNWKTATDNELANHSSAFTRMIGGWLFSDAITSYAILQSVSSVAPKMHVCSITTKLTSATFDQFRERFEAKYSATADRVVEAPTASTYRYSVLRGDKTTVRTSLVSTPAESLLTIRMIHGEALPPDS